MILSSGKINPADGGAFSESRRYGYGLSKMWYSYEWWGVS